MHDSYTLLVTQLCSTLQVCISTLARLKKVTNSSPVQLREVLGTLQNYSLSSCSFVWLLYDLQQLYAGTYV